MPGQQQQPRGDEGSLDFLWMIVLIIAIVLITWYFGKSYIAAVVYQIKLYEIIAIQFVIGLWDRIATILHLPIPNTSSLNDWADMIRLKSAAPDINTLIKVNTKVGDYLRIPVIIILLAMAARIYFGSITLKFKNTFSMKRLRNTEIENWPLITPTEKLDLLHTNLKQGKWAMALTPEQFCKQHNLIALESKNGVPTATLITGRAHETLALQLGPLWEGPSKLPTHMQALFAIFAAKVDDNIDGANKLFEQIAKSSINNQPDFSGTMQLLAKHHKAKNITKVMRHHAYVYTIMASMLELGRSSGVIATAEFLWLKPYDRKLWYVLNSVGRQTSVAEVAGIFSHWQAEKRLKSPIKTPMVEEAVRGLKEALEEIIYDPEEEEDE